MSKVRTYLKKTDAPYWVYTPVSGWTRFKLYMTEPDFRLYFGYIHPASAVWRALWIPALVVSAAVLLLFVGIAYGPDEAKSRYEEWF